uniref:Uncharacterized protein n=1 Tax=Trypanosoma congolense (strain IL3000) TaxID=1068625 RepID=G0UQ90_TRYCI|nr:conserved hypothetical protein [Trypanosoma congolense IL3000]
MRTALRVCNVVSRPGVVVRHESSQHWILNLLYGASVAPRYGSWSSFDKTESLGDADVPVLYCKALIHASGGGRRSRDWVAGSSAALFSSPKLMLIAMRHEGSDADVERYRRYLVGTLLRSNGSTNEDAAQTGSSSLNSGNNHAGTSGDSDAEISVRLGQMPEVRCFVYDAMRAAWFHRYKKVPENERLRLFAVAARLGLDEEVTLAIWQLVEKECAVARDKKRALENPWDD